MPSSLFSRFHLVHGSTDEPSRPEPLRHNYPHLHKLLPLTPKYRYLYLFVDQHEGSQTLQEEGQYFCTSVNKILIHVAFFSCRVLGFFLSPLRVQFILAEKRDKTGTKRNSRESHVNRTLYLHGPSQCKIEILLMEILTKRPFFPLNILFKYYSRFIYIFTVYSKYSFGSGLFTNRQVWQILVPVQRREGGREGTGKKGSCPLNQKSTLDPFEILDICVKGLGARMGRALSENEPWRCR